MPGWIPLTWVGSTVLANQPQVFKKLKSTLSTEPLPSPSSPPPVLVLENISPKDLYVCIGPCSCDTLLLWYVDMVMFHAVLIETPLLLHGIPQLNIYFLVSLLIFQYYYYQHHHQQNEKETFFAALSCSFN